MQQQLSSISSLLDTLGRRKSQSDTDDPQEERKNRVGKRPTAPGCMIELRVDRIASRVVHQHHGCHRQAAKGVERSEAGRLRGHGVREASSIAEAAEKTGTYVVGLDRGARDCSAILLVIALLGG